MRFNKTYIILFAFLNISLFGDKIQACSMYKITVDGKTMVGCNEDAWRTTSSIWFENAKNSREYGAGFTGSRQVGANRTAPQSGMNEKGLAFSRLAAYYPKQKKTFLNRLKIGNEVDYLTSILHKCATVKEVKKYIEQYDHSVFLDDVFIYVDSSGSYLIVEPYTLIEGDESHYVLSNFCPSITDREQARQLERYRNGEDFLNNREVNASLSFCKDLSDTMHVCRSRNGDGTLLTSIWDTQDKLVNLYFYHSFDTTVQFNLTEALAKGDHTLSIPDLFPKNSEFERLANYKTPHNTPIFRISLVVLGGILTFFVLLIGLFLIRNNSIGISIRAAILIAGMNLLLTSYLFVLATNLYIYYFNAPYIHYSSNLISASSYMPFLLLLTIVPFTLYTLKQSKSIKTKLWIKAMLISNNMIYIVLILAFGYWGLFNIWN